MVLWCVSAGVCGVASMLLHLATRYAALLNNKTMSNNIVIFSFDQQLNLIYDLLPTILCNWVTCSSYTMFLCMYVCMYVGFKTLFYVVRHLDSTASYLPTGFHLGFFRSWPSLYLLSSFSSVFLVLSFVSASPSMLFWVIILLPLFEHGRTM